MPFSKQHLINRIARLEHRISYNSELGNDDICLETQIELNQLREQLAAVLSDENDVWLQALRAEA